MRRKIAFIVRVLVIGGTAFIGRQFVEELRSRGHEVVLFNRGVSNPGLFPDIEKIRGDRATEIARIGNRHFDAVIDPSGYLPSAVTASTEFLRERAEHYTFISTLAAYDLTVDSVIDENSAPAPLPSGVDPDVLDFTYYGPLKALCEEAVSKIFGPERTLTLRLGFVIGPNDNSDRLGYWTKRFTRGGKMAAPSGPKTPVQLVDVRDIARWAVDMIDRRAHGTLNVTSPLGEMSIGDVFQACRAAATARGFTGPEEIIWLSGQFLESQGIRGWADMPLWSEPSEVKWRSLDRADTSRAKGEGLRLRPIATSVQDVFDWVLHSRGDGPWLSGISKEREQELIRAYQAQRN